jgi:ribosomal protein L11 methyltransferase
MDFITLKVFINNNLSDILKLELAEIGFDSFLEEEEACFLTSIEDDKFNVVETTKILEKYKQQIQIHYEFDKTPKQNWNKVWEQSYEPVFIGNDCVIRADFHHLPDRHFQYEIIINPKMSFGTGHHATTELCVKHLLNLDLRGKKVADIGCGTGVLSIMALKREAKSIVACDVEEWAVENFQENMLINGFSNALFYVFQGTAAQISNGDFEMILANINLNILLAEMHIYSRLLAKKGLLLLSGFYEYEIPLILREAEKYNLTLQKKIVKDNWAAILCEMV